MRVNEFEWSGKKILITGASGFKGSWLSSIVAGLGATVYGVTRRRVHPYSAYAVLSVKDRIVSVDADVSDRQQVYDMLNTVEPDVIFHLGAVATVPVALRDPRRAYEVNTFGTLNLLEGCRRLQIGKVLVVCSTDHVFGSRDSIAPSGYKEDSGVYFSGPYDTSKAAMELIVRSYDVTYANPAKSLAPLRAAVGITRCANVFGKGDVAYRRVIPNFVGAGVRTRTIPLSYTMNGRQFIYVTDAIEGYVRFASRLAASAEREPCKIGHFAITNYPGTSDPFIRLEQLATLVGKITKASVTRTTPAGDWAPNENREQALNCDATYQYLNWRPRKSLEQGLEGLPSWFNAVNKQDMSLLSKLAKDDLDETIGFLATSPSKP